MKGPLMTRLTAFSLLLIGSSAMAASDMPGMDHSQMSGMDHSALQSMDDGMMQPAAPTESRTPIPPLTDADRAAVFTSPGGHQVHDSAINSYFLADKLEWQDADDGSALAWDLSGWIGGDIDRLWLRSEGERSNGIPKTPSFRRSGAMQYHRGGTSSAACGRTSNPARRRPGPRSVCRAWRCTTSKPRPPCLSVKAARARCGSRVTTTSC
jgi:hypothetical protein